MKVLIIGSRGYMGRHLMARLGKRGVEVIGSSSSDGSGIDPDSGLLGNSFVVPVGTTAVVYMAQSPYYREVPQQASHVLAVNTHSAVRAATVARNAGVTRFIYVSTGTVYAPTFSPIMEDAPVRRDSWYVLSKLHGEETLALFRPYMDVIVVRPFGVYGPRQSGRLVPNLIHSVRNALPITLQGNPQNPSDRDGLRLSLCYIDDTSDIIARLIMTGGPEVINLASNEHLTIRDISTAIGEQLGIEPKFEQFGSNRDMDLIAEISKLRTVFPEKFTSFEDGLEKTLSELSNF